MLIFDVQITLTIMKRIAIALLILICSVSGVSFAFGNNETCNLYQSEELSETALSNHDVNGGKGGVKFTITPQEATVLYGFDKDHIIEYTTVSDGIFDVILDNGTYFFKVKSAFYNDYTCVITIENNVKSLDVNLSPAFGMIACTSNPSRAAVFVDDDWIGHTPIIQSDKIVPGKHTLSFYAENYYTYTEEIMVNGNGLLDTLSKVDLKPQYVDVTIQCDDQDALLIVTDTLGNLVRGGRSGLHARLNSLLTYNIEVSKPFCRSQSHSFQGREYEGQALDIHVDSPAPLTGTLLVSSVPSRADVYIDGVLCGTTLFAEQLIVGIHTVEIKLEGYNTCLAKVSIESDQSSELNVEMEEYNEKINALEWVDLGLPSGNKWATCNLGATKPTQYGDYYAWGEMEPRYNGKSTRRISPKRWRQDAHGYSQSNYERNQKYGNNLFNKKDDILVLDLDDDAVHTKYGGLWSMPTIEDWVELENNCDFRWALRHLVRGVLVTSRINGNTIFLPAAGYRSDTNILGLGRLGNYWSSSLKYVASDQAWSLYFKSNVKHDNHLNDLYEGLPIRPVYRKQNYGLLKFSDETPIVEPVDSTSIVAEIIPTDNTIHPQDSLINNTDTLTNLVLWEYAYSPEDEEIEEEAIPFKLVETKPSFRGGGPNEFSKWVNERLVYPEIAKENGVQGKVMLQFTVGADGRVNNVKVIRGVDPSIDKEAVRVVASSPRWSPGRQRDRAVRVTYTFPVVFQLR